MWGGETKPLLRSASLEKAGVSCFSSARLHSCMGLSLFTDFVSIDEIDDRWRGRTVPKSRCHSTDASKFLAASEMSTAMEERPMVGTTTPRTATHQFSRENTLVSNNAQRLRDNPCQMFINHINVLGLFGASHIRPSRNGRHGKSVE